MAKPTCILTFIVAMLFAIEAECQTVLKGASITSGGTTFEGNTMRLRGTVGETIAGSITSATYKITTGFIGTVGSVNTPLPDLTFLESNVNPLTITPGGTVKVTFTLKNTGDATLKGPIKIRTYLSNDTHFDPATDTALPDVFEITGDLAPNAQVVFPLGAQSNSVTIPENTPLQICQFLIVLDPDNSIAEKSDDNNTSAKPFEVNSGSPGSPAFGAVTRPSFFAADAKVSVQVINNGPGLNVRLFHRKLSAAQFDNTQMTADGATAYSIPLAPGWTDETGMEFYFSIPGVVTDAARYFLYVPAPATQTIPDLSFGGRLGNYRIVSIPYELGDNRIDEIFKSLGTYDKTLWRIVRYEGGKNKDKTDGLTKIERGQAFWFNSVDSADIRTGAGTTVNKDQSPDFSLVLEKGFNQVGDPFTFDISWADVIAKNPTLSTRLSHQILVYDEKNVALKPSDALKAWGGGFVLADEAMTVSIPVSLKNGAGRISSTTISNSNPDLDEWMLQIGIQQDEVLNSMGGIGMHPGASVSKDVYDLITPPRFIKYVGLNAEHNDFFEPLFSRDIVPTTTSYNWKFRLESNINSSSAEIVWNNNDLHTSTAELLLYDVEQRTLVDMKQADRYSFDPHRSRNFRFFFGSDRESIKPDIQECGIAWPNPVVDVAHVPFLVKERSHVQIDVYDLMGRRVNRIVDGEYGSGYHTALWNRNSSDGSPVSPGVYVYRMNGSIAVGRLIVN